MRRAPTVRAACATVRAPSVLIRQHSSSSCLRVMTATKW
ncbi:Uncharacterised protein [Mycobacteroides abscessus subsp. abscessus]|nr:Uncharacterised protein [Mycobacteroides abscessus subsp. abscessus]